MLKLLMFLEMPLFFFNHHPMSQSNSSPCPQGYGSPETRSDGLDWDMAMMWQISGFPHMGGSLKWMVYNGTSY